MQSIKTHMIDELKQRLAESRALVAANEVALESAQGRSKRLIEIQITSRWEGEASVKIRGNKPVHSLIYEAREKFKLDNKRSDVQAKMEVYAVFPSDTIEIMVSIPEKYWGS